MENDKCPYCKNGNLWRMDEDGDLVPYGTCDFCNGTGKKPCPICMGFGYFPETNFVGEYVVKECSCKKLGKQGGGER